MKECLPIYKDLIPSTADKQTSMLTMLAAYVHTLTRKMVDVTRSCLRATVINLCQNSTYCTNVHNTSSSSQNLGLTPDQWSSERHEDFFLHYVFSLLKSCRSL